MTKDQIKQWLKQGAHSRQWLADVLDREEKTVNNWLSSNREIPPDAMSRIERLMEDDAAAEAQRRQQLEPTAQVFSLEVDLPTFRAYGKAALHAGKTLEDWAVSELNEAAEAYHAAKARIASSPLPLAAVLAEDSPSYGSATAASARPRSPGSEAERSISDRLRDRAKAGSGSTEGPA